MHRTGRDARRSSSGFRSAVHRCPALDPASAEKVVARVGTPAARSLSAYAVPGSHSGSN